MGWLLLLPWLYLSDDVMTGLIVDVEGDNRWFCDVVVRGGRSASKAERSFNTHRRDCQCSCSPRDQNNK